MQPCYHGDYKVSNSRVSSVLVDTVSVSTWVLVTLVHIHTRHLIILVAGVARTRVVGSMLDTGPFLPAPVVVGTGLQHVFKITRSLPIREQIFVDLLNIDNTGIRLAPGYATCPWIRDLPLDTRLAHRWPLVTRNHASLLIALTRTRREAPGGRAKRRVPQPVCCAGSTK